MSDRLRPAFAYWSIAAVRAQVSMIARRHEPRVWLLWFVGFAVLVCTPVALADPAILALALDPELVAVLVLSAAALLRAAAVGFVLRALPASVARLTRPRHSPDSRVL